MGILRRVFCIMFIVASGGFAQVTVSGKFHGLDAVDLDSARVVIKEGAGDVVYSRGVASGDGSFALTSDHAGALILRFSAPHYRPLDIALLCDTSATMRLNVALSRVSHRHETADIAIAHPSSPESRFALLHLNSTRRLELFERGTIDLGAETRTVQEALRTEQEPVLRHELIMQYIELHWNGSPATSADSIRKWIIEIPPASPAWVYHFNLAQVACISYRSDPLQCINDIIAQHPSAAFAHYMYNSERHALGEKGETLPENDGSMNARPRVPVCHVGDQVPHFELPLLNNADKRVSERSIKGSFCLVEFWATWCSPCVAQLPYLRDAYERFSERGFTILSISEDDSAAAVARFQNTGQPMPWGNALVSEQASGSIKWSFGAWCMPFALLVGPEGTILAMGDDLKGDKLQVTLEKFVNRQTSWHAGRTMGDGGRKK